MKDGNNKTQEQPNSTNTIHYNSKGSLVVVVYLSFEHFVSYFIISFPCTQFVCKPPVKIDLHIDHDLTN